MSISHPNPTLNTVLQYVLKRKRKEKISESERRRLREIFQSYAMYKAFIELRFDNLYRIAISQNYIVVSMTTYNRYGERVGVTHYVLGLNPENKKVFIEKVGFAPTPGTLKYNKELDIEVNITTDKDIQNSAFGYDYDSDLDIIWKLDGTIRIQGDLLLSVLRQGDERYFDQLTYTIADRLAEITAQFIASRIAEVLQSYGLNTHTEERGITVPGVRPYIDENEEEKIHKTFRKILLLHLPDILHPVEEEFGLAIMSMEDKLNKGTWHRGSSLRITAYFDDFNYIAIDIWISRPSGWGEVYGTVNIDIETAIVSLLVRRAREIVEEIEKDLEFSDTTVNVGRHRVYMKARPTEVIVRTRFLGRQRTLFINRLPLVVKGEVIFEHPEHRTKRVTFTEPRVIEIGTIEGDRAFQERLNKYTLDELIKKFSD